MPFWLPYLLVFLAGAGLLLVTLYALSIIFPEGGGYRRDQGS